MPVGRAIRVLTTINRLDRGTDLFRDAGVTPSPA
jgi:hypothetical protein